MEQKKKALGRGLEQLFDSEVLDFNSFESNILEAANEDDIQHIKLDEIRSNPYQPRKTFNQEALSELAESIKTYGVFQPIIVKKSIRYSIKNIRYNHISRTLFYGFCLFRKINKKFFC